MLISRWPCGARRSQVAAPRDPHARRAGRHVGQPGRGPIANGRWKSSVAILRRWANATGCGSSRSTSRRSPMMDDFASPRSEECRKDVAGSLGAGSARRDGHRGWTCGRHCRLACRRSGDDRLYRRRNECRAPGKFCRNGDARRELRHRQIAINSFAVGPQADRRNARARSPI